MSSDLKTKSARANGAKSRGPATPEGRAKSSRNSLRHGLSAKSVVLPAESREQFQLLLDAHIKQFQPANPVEMDLVEAMAVARWRLRRIWAIETSLLARHEGNLNRAKAQRVRRALGPKIEGDRAAIRFAPGP